MSQDNMLYLIEQKGVAEIDLNGLNDEVRDVAIELSCTLDWEDGNDDLFKIVDGELKIHEYEKEFDNYLNVYGYGELYFLEYLSEHILNDVEFLFQFQPEGNPGCSYIVKKNKVKKIKL